jgi:hypothetical protein
MVESDETVTTRTVSVEISFRGDGTVVEKRPNVFSGGVIAPQTAGDVHFNVRREVPDEEGVLNPVVDEDTVEGAFQISIWGNSEGFRELGRYLLAMSKIDIGDYPSFHEHHDLVSGDGRTHLHIIVRRSTGEMSSDSEAKWIAGRSATRSIEIPE